jgi:hypothetical protein
MRNLRKVNIYKRATWGWMVWIPCTIDHGDADHDECGDHGSFADYSEALAFARAAAS